MVILLCINAIKLFCFSVAIFDLVQDVEAILLLSALGNLFKNAKKLTIPNF